MDSTTLERVEPDVQRLEPERFKVQFIATEEHVPLVEEAKALLSHAVPNVTLEELQMRAMRALVSQLKKKKHATVDSAPVQAHDPDAGDTRPRVASSCRDRACRADSRTHPERTDALEQAADAPHPRRRVRHIPAAVRRAVFERDGNRCSYLDANGARCPETHRLEFHHLKPFATGGDHCAADLTLRCAAHNALASEEDFGHELVEDRRNSPCSSNRSMLYGPAARVAVSRSTAA